MKKILFLVIMFVSLQIFSQTSYSSATDGDWDSQFSWTPNGVPGADDTVTLIMILLLQMQECASL